MRKKIVFGLSLFLMIVMVSLFNNEQLETKAQSTCAGTNFTNEFPWGPMLPSCGLTAEGKTEVTIDPSAWGQRLKYRYDLDFADMELDFNVPAMGTGEAIILLFTTNKDGWIGDAEDFVIRIYRGGKAGDVVSADQINILVGTNHDPNGAKLNVTAKYVEGNNPIKIAVKKQTDYEFSFSYFKFDGNSMVENEKYTVTNAEFKTWINSETPTGGLVIGGFERPAEFAPSKLVFTSVTDTFSRQYETTQKAEVEGVVAAYEGAALSSADELNTLLATRQSALDKIGSQLRELDKNTYLTRVNAKDTLIKNNETQTAVVASKITSQLDTLKTSVGEFTTETNITEEKITNYNATLTTIKTELQSLSALLSDAKQTEINGLVAELEYALTKATVTLDVIGYETAVNGEQLGHITATRIVELKQIRDSIDTNKLNSLVEADKTALQTRMTTANTTLEALEDSISGEVKELFVKNFEDALDLDLTVLANLTNAIELKTEVEDNVVFLETDAALEARFVAAVASLNEAIDDYLLTELTALKEQFNDTHQAELKNYAKFKEVMDRLEALDLTMMDESSVNKTQIEGLYNEVEGKIEAHILFGFSHFGMDEIKVTDEGIFTKGAAEHPRRTNYDLPFTVVDSEVVISFSEIAYYNVEDDNPDKGANNVVINILNKPTAYKSADETYGFSIMFWLFPTETHVQIYNNTDISLGSVGIPTPLIDENIVIKISIKTIAGQECWIVSINGYEIEIPTSGPAGINKDIFDDGKGYFSIASYANVLTAKNAYTIKKIGDQVFGNYVPDDDDDDDEPNNPDPIDDDNSNTDKEGNNATPFIIGGAAFVAIVCAGVVVFIRKKRI